MARMTIDEAVAYLDELDGGPGEAVCAVLDALEAAQAAIQRVRAEADKAEHGALRWEDPLPVPEWVGRVRRALDGDTTEEQR